MTRSRTARRITLVGLLALATAAAGCLGTPEARAGTEEADVGSRAGLAFPPVEHTLRVKYYAQAPVGDGTDTGNMRDANWQVAVPDWAREVRVLAEWTPSVPTSPEQGLMIHLGTVDAVRDLVGDIAMGESPLRVGWAAVPESEPTLVVMCHVYSTDRQPVAAEFEQDTRLRVEFR